MNQAAKGAIVCAIVAISGVSIFLGVDALMERPLREIAAKACYHSYAFEPTPDITAYQLAVILSRLSGGRDLSVICVSQEKPIPDDLLPQFRRVK